MLQALKVKDLTATLRGKGLYRARSAMEGRKEEMLQRYQKKFSEIEGEVTNAAVVVSGIVSQLDASAAPPRATQSSLK